MVLEATVIIIDNSEYMRNGDYQPTRFDAQADAVNTVFQTKIDSNPENTVGVMSMAGKGPEVLVTHTKDLGHILQAIHTTASKIGGSIDIPTAINIAQLALKHRENKSQRQRIIAFVGSPLEGPFSDEKNMIKLGKKLKKNNVAVDIVAFGDGIEESSSEGKSILKEFVESLSISDNAHYVIIPPGPHLLSDRLISSPILAGDRSGSIPTEFGGDLPASTSGAAANDYEFGVDPSLDPELAMALRLSMQEAQAREAAETVVQPEVPSTTTSIDAVPVATVVSGPTDDEEERMLQQALALSQQKEEDVDMGAAAQPRGDAEMEEGDEDDEDEDEDEDAAIARAIEMSMKDNAPEEKK